MFPFTGSLCPRRIVTKEKHWKDLIETLTSSCHSSLLKKKQYFLIVSESGVPFNFFTDFFFQMLKDKKSYVMHQLQFF